MPDHLDPRNDPDSQRGPESHPGGRGCGFAILRPIVATFLTLLVYVTVTSCACANASDGQSKGCVVDQTNEHRTDPNPHQPKPPDPICDYEFLAAWTGIPAGSDGKYRGVLWTFKAGGRTWHGGSKNIPGKPNSYNITGSWSETHRGLSCLKPASVVVGAVSGVDAQGSTACRVRNITTNHGDEDETRDRERRDATCLLPSGR